jgi:hypothetical protein
MQAPTSGRQRACTPAPRAGGKRGDTDARHMACFSRNPALAQPCGVPTRTSALSRIAKNQKGVGKRPFFTRVKPGRNPPPPKTPNQMQTTIRPGWAPDPLMVGIRSPDGLVVGLAPATDSQTREPPPPPHANSVVLGPAAINTHTQMFSTWHCSPGWAPDPLMVGIRSPDGLVVGSLC